MINISDSSIIISPTAKISQGLPANIPGDITPIQMAGSADQISNFGMTSSGFSETIEANIDGKEVVENITESTNPFTGMINAHISEITQIEQELHHEGVGVPKNINALPSSPPETPDHKHSKSQDAEL